MLFRSVSVFGEKVGDSACNSGSADLSFQVVCGRALSDGCARWSCCGGVCCMGSSEDCEAKGNERKERGLKKMLAKIV